MKTTVIVFLAVLGLTCAAGASEKGNPTAAAGVAEATDTPQVIAGLSALPVSPEVLPSSNATSALLGMTSLGSPGSIVPMIAPVPVSPVTLRAPEGPGKHSFLDKPNLGIFASVAAARTMDMVSTWQFRRHGLHEGELSDGFVDNKPLFATYSASLVGGQIWASYMFHRLGWHKMERATAMIHTTAVTEAVIHNYRIGTKH